VRVFPGPFLAGYASVKVVVQFWQARLVAITVYVPGRDLKRQLPRAAPEVLVVAGRGLIGPVIWTSREAV
jgi:hypothetical protein